MGLPELGSTAPLLRVALVVAVKAGLLATLFDPVQAWAQADSITCPMGTTFGDYLKDKDKVAMSERFHFTPQVETLIRGESTQSVGGDLHFMLQNYPNHHRALLAMVRLGEKEKTHQPSGAAFTIDCYFDRAIRFRRDDVVARMLYATYLAKSGRPADASGHLEIAAQTAADNPFTQYNVGLIYLEMKNYDRALEQAHKAYALGFLRSDLRDRLKSAGRWKEPEPASAASGAAGSASAAADRPASAPN